MKQRGCYRALQSRPFFVCADGYACIHVVRFHLPHRGRGHQVPDTSGSKPVRQQRARGLMSWTLYRQIGLQFRADNLPIHQRSGQYHGFPDRVSAVCLFRYDSIRFGAGGSPEPVRPAGYHVRSEDRRCAVRCRNLWFRWCPPPLLA